MARLRRFEIDELLLRPGTYFNPETEVLIVVDDTHEIDQAAFDADSAPDGGEWVLVADETPIDEPARDELLQHFQATYHEGAALPELNDEDEEPEDELEPDEDPDEL